MMLLDTSGLLCYLHHDERQHRQAVTLLQDAPIRLTHNYVLAEFVPLCQVRGFNRVSVLAFMEDLLNNPHVDILWVDETTHRAALALVRARRDKTHSLCDAVSVVLMRHYRIQEALTTDHHFEQEGFVRLLEP